MELRHTPRQARSRERLDRVLAAADALLAAEGPAAFTTTRIAEWAEIPVGSVYRFFDDKEAIAEALAVRYWREFEARLAATPTRGADPVDVALDALAGAFRERPGFLALWYGGLRSERVRARTRPVRQAFAGLLGQRLRERWPRAEDRERASAAEMVVLAGDGLLREAFRRDPRGDARLLSESKRMLSAYLLARLGPPA
jgi:AcrR family transcriptional regulator